VLYEQCLAWWAKYKDQTYWDEKRWKLVAKGQEPPDHAQAAKDRQEKAIRDMLNTPLTAAQIRQATNTLLGQLNADVESKAAVVADKLPDGRAQVKIEKPAEDQWVLSYPVATPVATITITLKVFPATSNEGDKAKPLQAVSVAVHMDSSGTEPKKEIRRVWLYDRIARSWAQKPD